MDPQVTWQLLLLAWNDGDWEEVIELASSLLDWLNKQGFAPETSESFPLGQDWNDVVVRAACTFARQRACSVLSDPDGIPGSVSFSLTCDSCRNDGPDSFADAMSARWIEIRYTPTMASANFVGLCPSCSKAERMGRKQRTRLA